MVDEEGNVVEKKNNIGSAAAGAAAGAALGAILGGPKGAGIGAGVGAVASLIVIKFSVRGANVTFDSGSELVVEVRRRNTNSERSSN
ncbi:MAG TPA: YMGG-like glycine zipper-containing protein [Blastocatellia bacterium]|nr:YMGG-like glycine zipper-containing protein [Blastocatellia bacterium]